MMIIKLAKKDGNSFIVGVENDIVKSILTKFLGIHSIKFVKERHWRVLRIMNILTFYK